MNLKEGNLDDSILFEGSVQVNPTGFGTNEESFRVTKEEIVFDLPSPISIKFSDILEVTKKTWLVFSSVIVIKYNEGPLVKEIKFTVTVNGLENPYLKRKVYQIILDIWRNKNIDPLVFNKMKKIVNSSQTDFQLFNFSKPYPWFRFIITIIIMMVIGKVLINILLN